MTFDDGEFDYDTDAALGPASAAQPQPKPYTSTIGLRAMRDMLANTEKTTGQIARKYGYTSDYDVTYDYGKYDPVDHRKERVKAMTLDQIDALQGEMIAHGGNSAVGRYQIKRKTLRGLRMNLGLTATELYSPEMQDRLADELLRGRKYDAFIAGKLSAAQFQDNLSQEWSSIPRPGQDGHSRYGNGRGGMQPAGITTAEFANLADFARTSDLNR